MGKIKFILAFFCLISTCTAYSQESFVGLSSGITFSNYANEHGGVIYDFKKGYDLNFFYERSLLGYLNVVAGCGYWNMGCIRTIYSFINPNVIETSTDNYLSIPILLKPHIGNKVRGYLLLGFDFTLLLKREISNSPTSVVNAPDITVGNIPEDNRIGFGRYIGLGGECSISERLTLGLDASSHFAYTGLYKGGNGLRNSALMINLSVKYKMK